MIVQNELRPGEKMKEMHLASRLGVSRTPVREAIYRLQHEGLVATRPGYVTVVTELTSTDLEEMYPIIGVLEGLSARLATPRLTAEDLVRLDSLIAIMTEHLRRGEIDKLMQADTEYHSLLYERTNNPRLQRMVRDLRGQLERFEYIFFSSKDVARTSLKRHKHLIRVLKKRDPEAAEKALLRQWEWGPRVLRTIVRHEQSTPNDKVTSEKQL
jgi:DNA-binding GntR family transcriptional regulator